MYCGQKIGRFNLRGKERIDVTLEYEFLAFRDAAEKGDGKVT